MRDKIPVAAKSDARAMRREPTEAERKLWLCVARSAHAVAQISPAGADRVLYR